MAQFIGRTITFNGVNSMRFGLQLCGVDNSNEREFGFNKSIEKVTNVNGYSVISSVTKNTQTYSIQLAKLDNYGNPMPISDSELRMISRWLFRDDSYGNLMVETRNGEFVEYYGMFIKGSIWQNEARHGYITVDFEMASPYGILKYQDYECDVEGEKTITIESRHDYDEFNPIDIEVEVLSSDLTITNETTNQTIVLSRIDNSCRRLRIYNENIRHIVNIDNPTMNVKPKFNNVYMDLAFGDNVIKIVGDCHIKFINKPKVALN